MIKAYFLFFFTISEREAKLWYNESLFWRAKKCSFRHVRYNPVGQDLRNDSALFFFAYFVIHPLLALYQIPYGTFWIVSPGAGWQFYIAKENFSWHRETKRFYLYQSERFLEKVTKINVTYRRTGIRFYWFQIFFFNAWNVTKLLDSK